MTDFHDSPSGLDPKDQKPWAEMSEVERLEYQNLVARRARIKYTEWKYIQQEEARKQTEFELRAQSISLGLFIFAMLLFCVFAILGI